MFSLWERSADAQRSEDLLVYETSLHFKATFDSATSSVVNDDEYEPPIFAPFSLAWKNLKEVLDALPTKLD